MRIIAGTARGRRLRCPRGEGTRPTADRVREAIFSILGDRVDGARVLDLFAGTGAMGLEALSRGAAFATFVERDRRALAALEANLAACGFGDRARVVCSPVQGYLRTAGLGNADLVFLDPPYGGDEAGLALRALGAHAKSDREVLVVLEHASAQGVPAAPPGLALTDTRRYGDTAVSFLDLGGPREE